MLNSNLQQILMVSHQGDARPARIEDPEPRVSVIIPAYNVSPYISQTLDSVMAQTFTNYEIILVNDGSPDTTELEEMLRPYQGRIVYLKQRNCGVASARNAAIRVARGHYLAFLDGDDLWLPDFLEKQMAFIESSDGYDLVYSNAYHFGDHSEGKTYMQTCPSEGEVNCESLLAGRCNVISSGVLARKDPIVEVGLFDEDLRIGEDFDLWVRLSKRSGARMNYQRDVLVGYRHRPGSLASDIDRQAEEAIRAYESVSRHPSLTPSERAILNQTLARQRALVATRKGKGKFVQGDFAEALHFFREAHTHWPTLKLKLLLNSIRLAPSLALRVYRLTQVKP